MIFKQFTKKGYFHEIADEENQDYLCMYQTEQFDLLVLADGATECPKGKEGAMLAAKGAAEVAINEGEQFFTEIKERIASLVTEQILYLIEMNKDEEEDITDYGSTLIFVCIRKKDGKAITFSLGDSGILLERNAEPQYSAAPRRYRDNQPCLTTTLHAIKAVTISQLNLHTGDRLFLCSDGFMHEMRRTSVYNHLMQGDFYQLETDFNFIQNPDDCSCLAYTWEG